MATPGLRVYLLLVTCILIQAEYISFDELYEDGLEAYFNNNWKSAIVYLERAIESYKLYKAGLGKCYRSCKGFESGDILINHTAIGRIVTKAACNRKCLDEEFGDSRRISRISAESKKIFEEMKPYPYLQFAYFKAGDLRKSVSVTHTYHLRYPDDKLMKANMDFFNENEEVTDDMFVNLEARQYLVKYNQGVEFYAKEDYSAAIELFEDALVKYYEEAETCQAVCEGENDIRETPDNHDINFFRLNADHYIEVLECSLKCVQELASNERGNVIHDFLPVQYHYLMFAYDQLDELANAVQCAKSYLVFHPGNKVMEKNLALYAEEINVSEFTARKEAVLFHRRLKFQSKLLRYSYQYFGMKDQDESILDIFPVEAESEEEDYPSSVEDAPLEKDSIESVSEEELSSTDKKEDSPQNNKGDEPYESMQEKVEDIIHSKDEEFAIKLERERRKRNKNDDSVDDVDISSLLSMRPGYRTVDSKYMIVIDEKTTDIPLPEGPILYPDIVFLANSTQMKGQTRFALDSLATDDECQVLIDLELSAGDTGDGYGGNGFPHTEHETFEGLSLLRAAELAKRDVVPLQSVLLYYDLSEKARAVVQAYFKLPELYFDYTHLVCRTALPDSPDSRDDLSHPVHADNCLLKSDGVCIKEHPAYTWRDYSAILYLNNDFDGGELLFTDSTARRVKTLVKPRCGRMVSFSAGPECFHGVKPILSGQRCAVALWFTMSKSKDEEHRIEAKKILDALVLKRKEEL